MKLRRHPMLVILLLMMLTSAGRAIAQDAGMSDVEIANEKDAGEGDKIVYTPGDTEVRYIPKASGVTSAKDSISLRIQVQPVKSAVLTSSSDDKQNEKQEAKSKDDSILTFNFLYYIIQKYKLQDIID